MPILVEYHQPAFRLLQEKLRDQIHGLLVADPSLDPRHSDFDGLKLSRAGLDVASPADSPAGMAWAKLSVPACAAYQLLSQT
jgi:hypothetical protein